MKVCKCPHIRHINSCINATYDVIFFTPGETGSAMMNSTHISLLKGMVHCSRQLHTLLALLPPRRTQSHCNPPFSSCLSPFILPSCSIMPLNSNTGSHRTIPFLGEGARLGKMEERGRGREGEREGERER